MPNSTEDKVSLGFLDDVPSLGGNKNDYEAQKRQIKDKLVCRETKAAVFLQMLDLLKISANRMEDKAALFDRMVGIASLGFPEIAANNIKTNH